MRQKEPISGRDNELLFRGFVLLALAVSVMALGCKDDNAGSQPLAPPGEATPEQASMPESSYPIGLSENSLPEEVAGALIQALDEKDKGTLRQLVAVEAGRAEAENIFQRHGKASNLSRKQIASQTVAGWQMTYTFYQSGNTHVRDARVNDTSAVVFADAKNKKGQNRTLKIEMVREDGLWKVLPGLKTIDG